MAFVVDWHYINLLQLRYSASVCSFSELDQDAKMNWITVYPLCLKLPSVFVTRGPDKKAEYDT